MSGSEMERQHRRINHIKVMTGKDPTVLDLNAAEFDLIADELYECPRYPMLVSRKETDKEQFKKIIAHGFELFGVRFIKGLST